MNRMPDHLAHYRVQKLPLPSGGQLLDKGQEVGHFVSGDHAGLRADTSPNRHVEPPQDEDFGHLLKLPRRQSRQLHLEREHQ
jgi:hypothetical protein